MASEHVYVPVWYWRLMILCALLLLLLAAGLMLWLAGADARPIGVLVWESAAPAGECLFLAPELPSIGRRFTLEIEVDSEGGADSGWGLWLGAPGDVQFDLIPPGYYHFAGETVPFLHVDAYLNTLRLDAAASRLTIWLNEEHVVDGHFSLPDDPAWGMVFSQDACLRKISVYRPD